MKFRFSKKATTIWQNILLDLSNQSWDISKTNWEENKTFQCIILKKSLINESSKKQATSGWFSADLWRQGKTSWWKFNYTKNARQKLTRTSFSCRKLIYDLSTLHENLHCTGSELFLLPWEKTKNKRGIKTFCFFKFVKNGVISLVKNFYHFLTKVYIFKLKARNSILFIILNILKLIYQH